MATTHHSRPGRATAATHHLAVLKPYHLRLILEGLKDIECRLSFQQAPSDDWVRVGDVLWLKDAGGPVRAVVEVVRVRTIHRPGPRGVRRLRRDFGPRIWAEQALYERMTHCGRVTLLWLGQPSGFEPFWVRKSDRRSWVVLDGPLSPNQQIASGL